MILTPLQKLPKNVEDLGKLIAAKGLKKLPKVQKRAQSGHIDRIATLSANRLKTMLPKYPWWMLRLVLGSYFNLVIWLFSNSEFFTLPT